MEVYICIFLCSTSFDLLIHTVIMYKIDIIFFISLSQQWFFRHLRKIIFQRFFYGAW